MSGPGTLLKNDRGLSSISGETRLAAVIGDPVRHSRSPAVHNAAFWHLGLDWVYVALPVAAGGGAAAVDAARMLGVSGLSVTMPHKAEVAAAVDRRTPAVELLGACNCVVRDGDDMIGHNTDGEGFVRSLLAETSIDLGQTRVVVVGAGGAAMAILHALSHADVAQLTVVNRSAAGADRAAALVQGVEVGTEESIESADLVVNATAAGMAGGPSPDELPFSPEYLRQEQVVADIVYRPTQTRLLTEAARRGARTVGGLGMLAHQAAIQFELWTGHPAPIDVMTQALNPETADQRA